jgi:hypothetical protein
MLGHVRWWYSINAISFFVSMPHIYSVSIFFLIIFCRRVAMRCDAMRCDFAWRRDSLASLSSEGVPKMFLLNGLGLCCDNKHAGMMSKFKNGKKMIITRTSAVNAETIQTMPDLRIRNLFFRCNLNRCFSMNTTYPSYLRLHTKCMICSNHIVISKLPPILPVSWLICFTLLRRIEFKTFSAVVLPKSIATARPVPENIDPYRYSLRVPA